MKGIMYLRHACVRVAGGLFIMAVMSSIATHYYTDYLLRLDEHMYSELVLSEGTDGAAASSLDNICSIPTRLEHIKQTCEARGWSQEQWDLSDVRGNIVVDDTHHLIYCIVSKVGSISFRSLLGRLILHDNSYRCTKTFINDTGCRTLRDMPRAEQLRVMQEYKKLMVVRHPLDKLRSAYDAKLAKPGYMNYKALKRNIKTITKYLIEQNAANFTGRYFDPDENTLTFTQFLDLVGTRYNQNFQDEHWMSIEDRCKPCQINYDFVLRLETLLDDSQPFYSHLQKYTTSDAENIEIPHENNKETHDPKEKLVNIRARFDPVDPALVKKVVDVYERDFTLFGYDWSFNSGAACGIDYKPGHRCC